MCSGVVALEGIKETHDGPQTTKHAGLRWCRSKDRETVAGQERVKCRFNSESPSFEETSLNQK